MSDDGRQTTKAPETLSGGQLLPTPSHCSRMSQTPAAGRQTAELLASAGHAGPDPVQVSAVSQTPAAARQVKLVGRNTWAGQASFTPSQFSAMSQIPAEARQMVEVPTLASP